jgi:hypothetical protein
MVSLPLDRGPARTLRIKFFNVVDACCELFAIIGAANRIANAVELHRQPEVDDLRVLGIRNFPEIP